MSVTFIVTRSNCRKQVLTPGKYETYSAKCLRLYLDSKKIKFVFG